MDDVIASAPDLVVIAGDLFQSVRPTNLAILHAFNQFRRLREALPHTPVVIVAGDHDTPRSMETGFILKLFEAVEGVAVVQHEVRQLTFPQHDLTVLAVPHAALLAKPCPSLRPPKASGRHVLVTHLKAAGALPPDSVTHDYGGVELEAGDLHADQWDYVALGDYHVAQPVRVNAWYAGALEHVSPNPWGELIDEDRQGRPGQKGWLLVELGPRLDVTFRPIPLARRLIDLEPIHARQMSAEAINGLLMERVAGVADGIDGQIVRQVVHDVPRPVARDIDHAAVREFKSRALHYQLDLRRPPPQRAVGVGAPGVRRTLTDVMTDYLERRPLDAALDRKRLVGLARHYMAQVEQDLLED